LITLLLAEVAAVALEMVAVAVEVRVVSVLELL
jgi:hypothetical protein